jgi:hypothetical protein
VFSVARAARAAGIEGSRRRLRLLTLSHGRVDDARRIDGIWVFSVASAVRSASAARAAGIEGSRRRLRLLTPSQRCVDAASRNQQKPSVERSRGLSSRWREVEGCRRGGREVEGYVYRELTS